MILQEVTQKNSKVYFDNPSKASLSTTYAVECYVCGKGLQDGHSITAKTLQSGIVLFCNVHYPLQ